MGNSGLKRRVVDAFVREYGRDPEVVTRAPGRLEILGNHTDYNEGVVLSVAINREAVVAAATREGTECSLRDIVNDDITRVFRLDDLEDPLPGDWINYVKGIIVELQSRDVDVPAFDAIEASTVPMSAGMSSSASLEMAVAYALKALGNIDLPWREWARIGQGSENNYVGANTGLMDQFSSIKGREECLVFSDFRSLRVENVALPSGVSLAVADSMVKHDLTDEYNRRRESCENAVSALKTRFGGISALRDVTLEQLRESREMLDPVVYRRALHVVGENERVLAGIQALADDDLESFGRLMFASHESSRVNFENSCAELDTLVDIASGLSAGLGARLSGGGFGGITVHLVRETEAGEYAEQLADEYLKRTGLATEVMICTAADGAEILA